MMMNRKAAKHAARGFTLIEIMIALLIVGILATFATTSYSDYTRRAQRAEARAILLEAAQFMQRFYAVNNAYHKDRNDDPVELPASLKQSPRTGTARYKIDLDPTKLSRFAYTLRAVPVGGDECGYFTLDNLGRMRAQGASNGNTSEQACLR
ncbi:MAG: type IV pilin protein [Lautropia sp.]|nr:type IV pilin protein [Lautropia sp.]